MKSWHNYVYYKGNKYASVSKQLVKNAGAMQAQFDNMMMQSQFDKKETEFGEHLTRCLQYFDNIQLAQKLAFA